MAQKGKKTGIIKERKAGVCSGLTLASLAQAQTASQATSPEESHSRLEFLSVISCFLCVAAQIAAGKGGAQTEMCVGPCGNGSPPPAHWTFLLGSCEVREAHMRKHRVISAVLERLSLLQHRPHKSHKHAETLHRSRCSRYTSPNAAVGFHCLMISARE